MDLVVWAAQTVAALLPVTNPLNGVALFTSMMGDQPEDHRRSQADRAGVYTFAILAVTAVAGAFILDFFGISLGMLQIAGGLIVGQAAWAMVSGNPQASSAETRAWAREKRFSLRRVPLMVSRRRSRRRRDAAEQPAAPDGASAAATTDAVSAEVSGSADYGEPVREPTGPQGSAAAAATEPPVLRDIAFSPLAMPLLAGPAAMGMVIGLTSRTSTLTADLGVFLGIAVIAGLCTLGLRSSAPIIALLGDSGILAFQRIFGFILLGIAVALVATGISALFGIPLYGG